MRHPAGSFNVNGVSCAEHGHSNVERQENLFNISCAVILSHPCTPSQQVSLSDARIVRASPLTPCGRAGKRDCTTLVTTYWLNPSVDPS